MDAVHEEGYAIRSLRWESACPECQERILTLLGCGRAEAARFCQDYFDRFYLLHKIGHIILHKFDAHHHDTAGKTEYLANLFAIKYLQYKGEDAFLADLVSRVRGVLAAHHAAFTFDIPTMNKLFCQYRKDLRTYGAFHFNSLLQGLSVAESLQGVIDRISGQQLVSLNHAIVLRRGIHGIQLINECLQVVFEPNVDVPEVALEYVESLQLDQLELVLT